MFRYFIYILVLFFSFSALAATPQSTAKIQSKLLDSSKKVLQGKKPRKALRNNLVKKSDDEIHARLRVTSTSLENMQILESLGVKVERVSEKSNRVQVKISRAQLVAVSELDFVEYISEPATGHTRRIKPFSNAQIKAKNGLSQNGHAESGATRSSDSSGSATTSGDEIHHLDQVRSELGFDGSGVKIGVISDGVYGIFDSVASGDIPSGTDTSCDPDRSFGTGVVCQSFSDYGIDKYGSGTYASEGLALLEILYDVAPGTSLYFANFYTSDDFIAAVEWLSKSESEGGAGVDVIVDDIGFYHESFFEDDDVALAVKAATDAGVSYVSAAGNDAHAHVQEDFTDYDSDGFHNFLGASAKYNHFTTTIHADSSMSIYLQWDDVDEVINDFDLAVYFYQTDGDPFVDENGEQVYFVSDDDNVAGTEEAFEGISFSYDESEELLAEIYIEEKDVTEAGVQLELFMRSSIAGEDDNEYRHSYDSVFGHPSVDKVITVGAMTSGEDAVAFYSSWGPNWIGDAWRYKTDIIATDGVAVTGHGNFGDVFYGTSAAAPHVAGCLALMLQKDSTLSVSEAKSALLSSATDIDEEDEYEDWFDDGYGFQAGYGLLNCYEAVSQID